MDEPVERTPHTPLWEVARVFLRLGMVSFGGPAAHVALMEEEIVRRRRWLTRETFLDLLGAANLIPGPNSTELAIHVGYARRWVAGTADRRHVLHRAGGGHRHRAGLGYVRYGSLPAIEGILAGVKPVVIAIVVQAIWNLGSRRAVVACGL
jgi:chromate transporter